MTENASTAELSADELAYFESGGETLPQEQPAVAPEPQAEAPQPEPQQPDRDEKGRFVPHQALHAEREEHKKTRSELQSLKEQQAVLNDRWNTLISLRQQQEQPKEQAPPDPETDIFGFAKWQADQLTALKTKIEDTEKQATQRQQVADQEQTLWNDWSREANAYAAEKPEFGEALTFLSSMRASQLKALGAIDPNLSSDQAITAQINNELRSIVIQSKQANVSPAKFVHDLAIAYGFKTQAPDPAPDPAKVTLPDKLANIAGAIDAAKTVGQSPGRAGGDALTPESIAAMSPAEFERWASDAKNARLLDKMLGA